ncbi:Protein of unknown function [Gillisia sp. Hel1_33_143]|uniref:DUF4199 domain-containing protein n=1 Tax=Gillisia sp. Hel1_33_143 TaxID=1336796 RepID=UPI000879C80C|nr:DUF4199 domain-containing protein [Gillisia sp. Hel1_33_143]SDS48410.1 Protein of unknown function [Gillisia sp. Hel1_33_143]
MEIKETNSKKFIINYGLLLGITSVLVGVIMYVTNSYLNPSWIYSVISIALPIVIITMGIKAFKTANGGFLGLGEAIKIGLGIAVIGGILTAIWSLLLMTVIEPNYMSLLMEAQQEKMLATNPNITQSQLDAAQEVSSKFSSPWIAMAMTIIWSLFSGLIISLISGLVMKKENPYKA